ncbi:DUF3574 domain-containing protein [Dyella subtropica]|uniref:DUF3574 domain-containing protein n=1 Tax=Dyella subtropica TaxID=2992127 RepID=UPI002258CA58|nr:DUF3574 domain-containing protein [Dyella subtropica]
MRLCWGCWRAAPYNPRLRSTQLVIDYPDTSENCAKVEAIPAAWKQRTGDQSVLRVTQSVGVSF